MHVCGRGVEWGGAGGIGRRWASLFGSGGSGSRNKDKMTPLKAFDGFLIVFFSWIRVGHSVTLIMCLKMRA